MARRRHKLVRLAHNGNPVVGHPGEFVDVEGGAEVLLACCSQETTKQALSFLLEDYVERPPIGDAVSFPPVGSCSKSKERWAQGLCTREGYVHLG